MNDSHVCLNSQAGMQVIMVYFTYSKKVTWKLSVINWDVKLTCLQYNFKNGTQKEIKYSS